MHISRLIFYILLPVLIIGCATVPITGRRQLALVPAAELLPLSEQSYKDILAKATVSTDPIKNQLVVRVGKRIAAAAEDFLRENGKAGELANYAWEFTVIQDDKNVNAFCMPGGKVVVYTGILPVAQSDAGLAVVLGHEVAHAIANHGAERMSQLLLVQMGEKSLAGALKNQPEKTSQLLLSAFGMGTQVGILLPYSRTHELEADRIGLDLMARAGYDPREAVPFWQRMNEVGGTRPVEFLSTHPAPARRITDIEASIPEALKYYKP